jgi:hypothetical protein
VIEEGANLTVLRVRSDIRGIVAVKVFVLGERKKEEGADEEELNGTGRYKDGGVCISVSTLYLSSSNFRVIR